MRVALCQIEVISGDRVGNFSRNEAALSEAKHQRADLAVFPESAILGWICPAAHDLAHPIPGEDSDRLCQIARDHAVAMIIGIDEKSGDQLYDSAIAIDSDGRIIAKHRKFNVLPELMDPPYATGEPNSFAIAEFDFGRVALVICADTFIEATIQRINTAKPDLLAVPYGWVADPKAWPQHGERLHELIIRLAKELNCPVVGVDAVGIIADGPWAGRKLCGASLAANREGAPITAPTFGAPTTVTVEMKFAVR